MKIVNRGTFLALPEGTVYADYEPCFFGAWRVKGESLIWPEGSDFFCSDLIDIEANNSEDFAERLEDAQRNGASLELSDVSGRDGMFNHSQLYAILEPADIEFLIERLKPALNP